MSIESSPGGSFLAGFANGFSNIKDRQRYGLERERDREERAAERELRWAELRAGGQGGYGPDTYGEPGSAGGGSGGGGFSYSPRMKVADPAATDLAPHQRAFLNAVSVGESGGAYDVRYTPRGGATFDLSGGHPRVYEPGPHGKSSAAGRYQFTWTTWKGIAGADTPFTPENQDRYAWKLATSDYRARTGRDLDADLRANGLTDEIMGALTPTWQAFKKNRSAYRAAYDDSFRRYTEPPVQQPQEGRTVLSFGQQVAQADTGATDPMSFILGKMK